MYQCHSVSELQMGLVLCQYPNSSSNGKGLKTSKTEVLQMPSATHVNLYKVVDEVIGK